MFIISGSAEELALSFCNCGHRVMYHDVGRGCKQCGCRKTYAKELKLAAGAR